jgi:hypothetical protein
MLSLPLSRALVSEEISWKEEVLPMRRPWWVTVDMALYHCCTHYPYRTLAAAVLLTLTLMSIV